MTRSTQSTQPLIIDSPELQARHRRVVYSAATLVAWSVWMYLWLPLVSLLAWWFGVRTFTREFVVPETRTLLLTLGAYGLVIAVLVLLVVGWSYYNLRRFGPRGRRKAPPPVTDAEIAAWFGVPELQLPAIRTAASQVVRFPAGGNIEVDGAAPRRAVRDSVPVAAGH